MAAPIRVLVSGSGNMGRTVMEALDAEPGIEPVGVLEKFADAPSLRLASGRELPMTSEPDGAFTATPADVVVDFTNAAWTPIVADAALRHGVRPVIGTSGLSEAFVKSLGQQCAAKKLGGLVAANFALGAVLLMHMARIASRYYEAAEIIELHHDRKVDAPSGTAVATARGMVEARGRPFARNVPETETVAGARAASIDGVTVHSVRLPGLVAHQEVIFGGRGETLTLRHDSLGRDSFMPGVILATREVMSAGGLVIGLGALLGLEG